MLGLKTRNPWGWAWKESSNDQTAKKPRGLHHILKYLLNREPATSNCEINQYFCHLVTKWQNSEEEEKKAREPRLNDPRVNKLDVGLRTSSSPRGRRLTKIRQNFQVPF